MKRILVSGYFSPVHVGHLEYFEAARKLGDELIVLVNNDEQVKLKGSIEFMGVADRARIVKALRSVSTVFVSMDFDRSVCRTIEMVHEAVDEGDEWIFANGGDQTAETIPETEVCEKLGIKMVFGVCPQLRQSSEILKAVKA